MGRRLTKATGGPWGAFTVFDVNAHAGAVVCHQGGHLVEFSVENARELLHDRLRDPAVVKGYTDWVAYRIEQLWMSEVARALDVRRCRVR